MDDPLPLISNIYLLILIIQENIDEVFLDNILFEHFDKVNLNLYHKKEDLGNTSNIGCNLMTIYQI